jgi:hypothetical protein
MPQRAATFAAVAAVILLGAAGCRRSPLADGKDAGADHPMEGPRPGDGPADAPDAPFEVAAEAIAGDAAPLDGSPAPLDADAAAGAVDAAGDAPTDRVPVERPDATDARPEDQPCGPSGFYCAPFACDVARGICKSVCATDDDCTSGRPCRNGTCGGSFGSVCTSNDECSSGFCAQGVCCSTVCNQTCFSCALPATVGVCRPVPQGMPDPGGRCTAVPNLCNGSGGCLGAQCANDIECAVRYWCTGGRCLPCTATCASNADCASNICIRRNECSYCATSFDAGP